MNLARRIPLKKKIRITGLRGENNIDSLCRRKGLPANHKRLMDVTAREGKPLKLPR